MSDTVTALSELSCETTPEVTPLPLVGMRVLVMTSGHHVCDARVYSRHARSLHLLGADVTLVGPVNGSIPTEIKVRPVASPGTRWARFILVPWRCIWSSRGERCDIVHFHDAEILPTLPVAKLFWPKAAFVYDVHEDFSNLILIRDWLPDWTKPCVRAAVTVVEKTLTKLVDAVVGVTPPLTSKFAIGTKETAFNYPTRDFYEAGARVSVPARLREFDLVHLGTLNARRASFLCDVLDSIYSVRPSVRTLLVGVRPEIARIIRSRVPNGCVILGNTPYREIPALLGNSRIGLDVHPWAESHLRVAVPVKIFEYMASGCAIVCSSMPVLDGILDAAGMRTHLKVLCGGSPADYADKILETLGSIDSGDDPGTRLRTLASQHTVWEKESQKIASLYLNLLARRKLPWKQDA